MSERTAERHNRITREIVERIAREIESFSDRMTIIETLVLAYLIGRGTEAFRKLIEARAARTGEAPEILADRIWENCEPVRVRPLGS